MPGGVGLHPHDQAVPELVEPVHLALRESAALTPAKISAHYHAVAAWLEVEWPHLDVAVELSELRPPAGNLVAAMQVGGAVDLRVRLDVRVQHRQERIHVVPDE